MSNPVFFHDSSGLFAVPALLLPLKPLAKPLLKPAAPHLARVAAEAALLIGYAYFSHQASQDTWAWGPRPHDWQHDDIVRDPFGLARNELDDIAGKHGLFGCIAAARDMARHLEQRNEEFLFAEIWFEGIGRRNYVVSDIFGGHTAISETGYHVGILHSGIIRCNIHPQGLPRMQWYSDFHGLGRKITMENPIPLGPEFNPFNLL